MNTSHSRTAYVFAEIAGETDMRAQDIRLLEQHINSML